MDIDVSEVYQPNVYCTCVNPDCRRGHHPRRSTVAFPLNLGLRPNQINDYWFTEEETLP